MAKVLIMKAKADGEPSRSAIISDTEWPFYMTDGWIYVGRDPGPRKIKRRLIRKGRPKGLDGI